MTAILTLAPQAQAVLIDAGTLYLELNSAVSQVRWGDRPGGEADAIQPLRVVKKCEVDEQNTADPDLIGLVGSGTVGLSFNSLGIASSKGVGCGRLESRLGGQQVNQSLTLGFASALSGVKAIEVNLDLELKGNVEASLITSLDGAQTGAWSLLSGSNAVGSLGCDAVSGEICESSDVNILCPSNSDSGSDNGGTDNCKVVLNVEADTVFIQALDGELGLEGGGDSGTEASQFNLAVEFEGELDCLENVSIVPTDPSDAYNLTIRRLTNLDGSQCDLIPYDLDFDGQLITFEKLDLGQLIAHDINVQFENESVPTPACYPSCTDLGFIPSTLQQFSGAPTEIAIPACTGTPVFYDLAEAFDPDTGEDLVGELKMITPPSGGWVDLEPSLPGLQHGCWYDQDIDLLGPDPETTGNIIIRVGQKIYLIGDWAARRGVL
ncbi:MAG: hypothetical protein NXH95_08425 [Pseudomonadaceae bacterium]|nr:hypothetical protein [Pseudomonadaceae bacterium]